MIIIVSAVPKPLGVIDKTPDKRVIRYTVATLIIETA